MHGHVPIITNTCKYHMSNMHAILVRVYNPQNLTCLPCIAHASLVPVPTISLGTRL